MANSNNSRFSNFLLLHSLRTHRRLAETHGDLAFSPFTGACELVLVLPGPVSPCRRPVLPGVTCVDLRLTTQLWGSIMGDAGGGGGK